MNTIAPLRVALIDDSAVVRKHLAALLEAAGMRVTITASDPVFAWPKLEAAWPDVIVLDVEMPRMDGISFLKQLMSEHPLPVVMCSTLTEAGCETTLQALAIGAVGFVTKPKLGLRDFMEDPGNGLVAAVRAAARANLHNLPRCGPAPEPAPHRLAPAVPAVPPAATALTGERMIALGASTGGVQTVEALLRQIAAASNAPPGILLVQHMPPQFTAPLAAQLARTTGLDVLEARDGDRLIGGRVLIAPGGLHMQLRRSGTHYLVEVRDGPLVNHHRPSVDVLFRSVAQSAGRHAVGALLTGMGEDGARGLLAMRQAGARTLAQDESSCVVYGMPRAAMNHGAAERAVPLSELGRALLDAAR